MAQLGYKISSEEHAPNDLVRYAQRAEELGFTFGMISDHFHPWVDKQGHSPFVWAIIGGIAQATERLELITGVTCPTIRIHPAIIAQAAAAAAMMPGRFILGLGSGENLNEHILGDKWPPALIRIEMMEEAVEVIRTLWKGGLQDHHGKYYTVENARIYTLPEELPPIFIAAAGEIAARTAGQIGDGLVTTSPDKEVLETFRDAGGEGKPGYAEFTVCWAETEEAAVELAHEWWPNAGMKGQLSQELALPSHFEQAAQMVTKDDIAEAVVCGPDAQRHIEGIREYFDAGYDHVAVHQIGPDQEGFFKFYEREILPALQREGLIDQGALVGA
jgi:coenzyme F420-dependent glucose-6-phosphate dehydrogenase